MGEPVPEGIFRYAPSVSARSESLVDVFAVNASNEVVSRTWDGEEWSEWAPVAIATVRGPVDSTSWSDSRIDLLSVDEDGALIHKYYVGPSETWFDAVPAPGDGISVYGPAITGVTPMRLWAFFAPEEQEADAGSPVVGYYYNGTEWLDARTIVEDGIVSNLDASSVALDETDGAFVVAARTANGQFVAWATVDALNDTAGDGAWGPTELPELEGGFVTAPCITHDGTTVHYVGVTSDGHAHHIEADASEAPVVWSEWEDLGGSLESDPDCKFVGGQLWVVGRTTEDSLGVLVRDGDEWGSWEYLTGDE